MEVLTFKVKGNVLSRTNMTRLISCTRNNIFAKFTFDDEWSDVIPKAVQFYKSDECCYSVEIDEDTCTCAIPWEILEQSGCVHITVMGGDLLVTNSVGIAILDSGLIGGLAPTVASPSLYSDLQTRVATLDDEKADKSELESYLPLTGGTLTGILTGTKIVVPKVTVEDNTNLELSANFETSTYPTVKDKFKLNSSGFDLSVESTNSGGTVYKNQIKTSNSKITVNANDLEFNSDKNERHNVTGKYQVDTEGDIEISTSNNASEGKVFYATSSQTGIYYGDNSIELGQYNTNINVPDNLQMNTDNERHEVNGTYEVINAGSTLTRIIQKNANESKSTKLYLGTDNAIIGVADNLNTSSDIVSGIEASLSGVDIIGENIKINGEKLVENLLQTDMFKQYLMTTYDGTAESVYFLTDVLCGGVADTVALGDNVTAYVCNNGECFVLGSGAIDKVQSYDDDTNWNISVFAWDDRINILYIGNGITTIGDDTFAMCEDLTSVVILNGVTTIGSRAFSDCSSLASVMIPNSVTSIGYHAFYYCDSLTSVTINKPADSISGSPWGTTKATIVWNG